MKNFGGDRSKRLGNVKSSGIYIMLKHFIISENMMEKFNWHSTQCTLQKIPCDKLSFILSFRKYFISLNKFVFLFQIIRDVTQGTLAILDVK